MPVDLARVENIFAEALAVPTPDGRSAYLDRACAGDDDLRRRVEALLASHVAAGSFLPLPDTRLTEAAATALPAEGVGARIGQYTLLDVIGEGGFGTVYLAEQRHPVRRRVALKVIKLGMDTKDVIARFEAERQALAIMDHPNIARVFDAGATAAGRPYFVMELVNGVPVTKYCDSAKLTPRQRIELFVPICQAVQHAHQKGVIHRDLKPSNVLVTLHDGKPVPKVIDFGIAKATQARLTDKTLFTQFRTMIGTPEYMSPEQADSSGLDIDTRSDVYSLGVMLYEMLTGVTPFDGRELRSKAYAEIQRIIREVDPPRPSTRLSSLEALPSIAANRRVEPHKLTAIVRGELDWIVMKCMEKDRARRYESAAALAADLNRHLADEPVSAAAPSAAYQLRKFVHRNRGPVLASLAVLLALVGGVVGTTIGLIGQSRQRAAAVRERAIAEQQAAEAKRQAAIAEAVSQFQKDMLGSADPDRMMGDKVTVIQTMTAAVKGLDGGKLKDQPLIEARVRNTIGTTLQALGRYDAAEPVVRKALELRRAALPPGDPRILEGISGMTSLLMEQGRYDEADPLVREEIDLCRRTFPRDHPATVGSINDLAELRRSQGRFDEAEQLLREVLDLRRQQHPVNDRDLATAVNNLAMLLQAQGKVAAAEPLFREALGLLRNAVPAGHPLIGASVNNLGLILQARGQFADAEPLLREALEIRRKALPSGHPQIAAGLNNLGGCLKNLGRLEEAEQLYREALQILRAALPAGHPHIATTLNNLARLSQAGGKFDESEQFYRESLMLRRAALPPGHPDIAQSLGNLGELLAARKRFDEAEPLLRESLVSYDGKFGTEHLQVGLARQRLGRVLTAMNRFTDAEEMLLEANRVLSKSPRGDSGGRDSGARALLDLYIAWDRAEPNQGYAGKAQQWQSNVIPRPTSSTHPATMSSSP